MDHNLKPLTDAQARELLNAAIAWQEQGSRSKFKTNKTLNLWDVVESIKQKNTRARHNGDDPPVVGTDIYVETHLYVSHGRDDVTGGLAQVAKVEWDEQQEAHFVMVLEHEGHNYRWEEGLREKQVELAKEFGDSRAHPCPDMDPEANRWD